MTHPGHANVVWNQVTVKWPDNRRELKGINLVSFSCFCPPHQLCNEFQLSDINTLALRPYLIFAQIICMFGMVNGYYMLAWSA